jgi:hypothetical protein
MTTALDGVEGSASRPGRSLPRGKTQYPLYRRLGGPQGRSGQVRKISPPPGFDRRTVQPVASRYTDLLSVYCRHISHKTSLSILVIIITFKYIKKTCSHAHTVYVWQHIGPILWSRVSSQHEYKHHIKQTQINSVVISRHLSTEHRLQSHANPRGIWVRQSGLSEYFRFLPQYLSTNAPYSFISCIADLI